MKAILPILAIVIVFGIDFVSCIAKKSSRVTFTLSKGEVKCFKDEFIHNQVRKERKGIIIIK
jgi:hypothetical protein